MYRPQRITWNVFVHGINRDCCLQCGAAHAVPIPGPSTGSNFDGGQRQHGRQDHQYRRVGQMDLRAAEAKGIPGAQAGRAKDVQPTPATGAFGTPGHGFPAIDGGHATYRVIGEVGVIQDFQPKRGKAGMIGEGVTFLEHIPHLCPAVAHFPLHGQLAAKGEGPQVANQPGAAEDDQQG